MFKKPAFWLILLLLSTEAFAVSVSFLQGDNFRDDLGYRKTRTTYTLENFSVWEYGTLFFYYDITDPFSNDQGPRYYSNQFFGGISPTFSLSKITNRDLSYGILKDVSIRLELENGSGSGQFNFQNYFYGLQYDLIIPGFDFFSLNTVVRDNPRVSGVGLQIGLFWQVTGTMVPGRNSNLPDFLPPLHGMATTIVKVPDLEQIGMADFLLHNLSFFMTSDMDGQENQTA
jgi:nucleoside-specific outer membrane channel protein Tsx